MSSNWGGNLPLLRSCSLFPFSLLSSPCPPLSSAACHVHGTNSCQGEGWMDGRKLTHMRGHQPYQDPRGGHIHYSVWNTALAQGREDRRIPNFIGSQKKFQVSGRVWKSELSICWSDNEIRSQDRGWITESSQSLTPMNLPRLSGYRQLQASRYP